MTTQATMPEHCRHGATSGVRLIGSQWTRDDPVRVRPSPTTG